MSVADLKARCADVPGIQNLTMGLSAGRISLAWGNGYSASADASASDAEIEVAIRNAIRLPPLSLIPDKPIPPPAASGDGGSGNLDGRSRNRSRSSDTRNRTDDVNPR